MSRVLRYENARRPLIRVLYADTFSANGSGPWTEAEYWSARVPDEQGPEISRNGIVLESCTRQVLPGIGEAVLTCEYGTIDGARVEALDLLGKHIRIQAAARPSDETQTPAWRTIWLGRCEWQDDSVDAAASALRGTRTYRCVDLLYAYLRGYPMDRHAHYALPSALGYGHPGYNYDRHTPDIAIGNREATGATYTGPDSTAILVFGIDDPTTSKTVTTWTDAQAVANVMHTRRESGDPIFDVDDPAGLLSEATAIPVRETENAWEVASRICDRRRGKGMAFLGWDDDVATPTGAIDVKLRVRPQLASTLTYTYAGSTVTINGADGDASWFTTVDLQGDQRLDGPVTVRDTQDSAVDQLTTEGEQIEVVVTASGDDGTLAERWSVELETEWAAADEDKRKENGFRPVLQYYGLLRSIEVAYKNGDGAGSQRADWITTSTGDLQLPSPSITAPNTIKIMDDLPLYEGYDYEPATPVPLFGGTKDGKPRRRKPLVLVRTASGRFLPAKDYPAPDSGGAQVSVDDDGIWVEWASGDDGARTIRDEIDGVDESSVTLTIGLQMPQRVSLSSSNATPARRKRTIRVPDLHLWIGHAGAIWDVDGDDIDTDGYAPKRIGGTMSISGGTTNGKILRDDRAKLARIHYLAWEWYRSDSARQSATWSLRDCGLLPSWKDIAGTDQPWPTLGQMATTMSASGQTYTLNTPISRVSYDNRSGVTTWETDWMEFDHGAA